MTCVATGKAEEDTRDARLLTRHEVIDEEEEASGGLTSTPGPTTDEHPSSDRRIHLPFLPFTSLRRPTPAGLGRSSRARRRSGNTHFFAWPRNLEGHASLPSRRG